MQVIDPTTGEAGETYEAHDDAAVEAKLAAAEAAQRRWADSSFADRSALLRKAAEVLKGDLDTHAERMAHEMGKPISQGRSEAKKCAWALEHYAEHAEGYLASERADTEATWSGVVYRPLGICFAIMPWNYPYWQVIRQAAPGIAAGNVTVLKHASNVPGCAVALEQLFRDAGADEGLFTTLLIDRDQTEKVIRDARVKKVSITGSVGAGRKVAKTAGEALTPHVLELGGSDPYLVLEDADLDLAAEQCVEGRLLNSGQSCIAAKRFVVVEAVREAFTERVVERMKAKKMASPFEDDTDVGPQARKDLRDELHEQVEESVQKGARRLLGGEIPDGPGFFYPPTVLADVEKGMPAADDETFGPVAAILAAKDEADAIAIANSTPFGLGAAVFTQDLDRGRRIAERELHAGAAFVNAFVKSDPRLPFGGIGDSGYGRELARHGILELVNAKTLWVA